MICAFCIHLIRIEILRFHVICCPSCHKLHNDTCFLCISCGYRPEEQDGIPVLAPEVSVENESFSEDLHGSLLDIEERSPWFVWRSKLINFMISKASSGKGDYCEIGCGNGYVLSCVAKAFPAFTVYGTEILTKGMVNAKQRLPSVCLFQSDATRLPFIEHFNIVGAYDVLEHIPDDVAAMKSAYMALRPGGAFLITVPQHMFLWSFTDDIAFHKRRYSRKEMTEKLQSCGFRVEYMSSYAFVLMPLLWIFRCIIHKKDGEAEKTQAAESHLAPTGIAFKVMNLVFAAEYLINKVGIRVPFGSSMICIARKPL